MWTGSVSLNDPIFAPELRQGENLLWRGQPRKGLRLQPSDALLIPFSIMWAGFAFFWEAIVLKQYFAPSFGPLRIPIVFPLWGIPFVVIGIYMLVGRFFFDAASRNKTHYAVTDRRILIVNQLFGYKVKSLDLKQLPEITLSLGANGSGSIAFGPVTYGRMDADGHHRRYQPPTFQMIEDARQVHDLIQNARQNAK